MRLNERVDEDVELAALRRRAYGPDADIDAAGLARLTELQSRSHDMPDLVEAVPAELRPVPEAEAAAAPAAAASDPAPASAPTLRDRVRIGWPLLLAGALGGAVLAGAVGAGASQFDRPYATLTAPAGAEPSDRGPFGSGIPYGTVGEIEVGTSVQAGEPCLWLRVPIEFADGFFGDEMTEPIEFADCAPEPFIPRLRLTVGAMNGGWGSTFPVTADAFPDVPAGSSLEFSLRDDVVIVRLAEPATPSPAQDPADGAT